MTEINVDLKDKAGSNSIIHHAEIAINSDFGINVNLFRDDEEIAIGTLHIENWNGDLKLRVWTNGYDDDPAYSHNFSDDHPDFYMKCGWAWQAHNEDGSCVEEGDDAP